MIEWLFKKLLWNGQCGRSLQRRPKEFALQSTWTCIFQQRLLHFLLVDLSKHIILYTETVWGFPPTFIYLLESQNDRKRGRERERSYLLAHSPNGYSSWSWSRSQELLPGHFLAAFSGALAGH